MDGLQKHHHYVHELQGYPLTLADFSNWALVKVFMPLLKGVIWIGEPGFGKTLAANSLAVLSVLLSAYWRQRDEVGGEPSFKTGSDLDFFCTDPGKKVVPK
eukprot:3889026-Amphidinium_carterae.1